MCNGEKKNDRYFYKKSILILVKKTKGKRIDWLWLHKYDLKAKFAHKSIDARRGEPIEVLRENITPKRAAAAIIEYNSHYGDLNRVLRNNIAKEIYGSEVLLSIKIEVTPMM
ncbi:hypothetical protein ACTFIW_003837 [Dictyostelium discoideum]